MHFVIENQMHGLTSKFSGTVFIFKTFLSLSGDVVPISYCIYQ